MHNAMPAAFPCFDLEDEGNVLYLTVGRILRLNILSKILKLLNLWKNFLIESLPEPVLAIAEFILGADLHGQWRQLMKAGILHFKLTPVEVVFQVGDQSFHQAVCLSEGLLCE